ncbi:hypothetical protein, conserved [Babesia ovata]|uniref:Uncharacterized protein n=1 Tax=Babesia ovata TaxID=189622 RepID=A0A2H6K6G3_9APIC|nr:uncharacterized protein BOVATA_000620 [Babesia ovata]GBE58569.1 hypothetical protein, conserved [Babesia ovata]
MAIDHPGVPRKRGGRRYQFDPLAVSAAYPLVAQHVRKQVIRDRLALKRQNSANLRSRRALFERLSQMERQFVRPQSLDELVLRATALNEQLAIQREIECALTSLLCVVQRIRRAAANQEFGIFSAKPSTWEEQRAERDALEALRAQRAKTFVSELMARSEVELERRRLALEEAVRRKEIRDREEQAEEEETMLGCDRKLLASGVYRAQIKPHHS